jgi:AraC family transcriptional regulator
MAHARPTPYLFPETACIGADNVVLHARSRRHSVDGFAGPLSIKTVLAGQVSWNVGGRELIVDRSSFLILSAGEKYSMNIAATKAVETCCVFFAPDFVERVALDTTSPVEQSLDAPDRTMPSLPYLSALHSGHEHALVGQVHTLAPRCREALAPSGFEEDFLLLAAALLQLYEQIRQEAARVPAMRRATRQELFRRLLVGREYMHSHTAGPVSLATIAGAACLSPFHFHRGFTHAFQQTPHSYLTRLRLAQARNMIETGSLVLDACLEVGFLSPSAFSRLYRARYGESPSDVRRKFARSGKNTNPPSGTLGA